MSMASVLAKPAPTAAPISSSKYGKCHLSGASTTPSREMKKFDLILRTRRLLAVWSRKQGVHLADRHREDVERAPALQVVHVLRGLELEAQLHPRARALLGEPHLHRRDRRLLDGEAVGELEARRRLDGLHAPPAVRPLAVRPGHEVADLA